MMMMCRDVPCHDDVPCHHVSFVSCYCEEDADWRGVVLLKKSLTLLCVMSLGKQSMEIL
jgi:hypothetical protein